MSTGGAEVLPLCDGLLSLESQTVRVEEPLTAAAPDQLMLGLPPLPAQTDLHPTTGQLEEAGLAVPAGPGTEGVGETNTVVVEPAATGAVTAYHVVVSVGGTTPAVSSFIFSPDTVQLDTLLSSFTQSDLLLLLLPPSSSLSSIFNLC